MLRKFPRFSSQLTFKKLAIQLKTIWPTIRRVILSIDDNKNENNEFSQIENDFLCAITTRL